MRNNQFSKFYLILIILNRRGKKPARSNNFFFPTNSWTISFSKVYLCFVQDDEPAKEEDTPTEEQVKQNLGRVVGSILFSKGP